jgi:TonB family protein
MATSKPALLEQELSPEALMEAGLRGQASGEGGAPAEASPEHVLELGILPERKIDKRAVGIGYGSLLLAAFLLVNLGLLAPDHLTIKAYRVTELIPMPSLRPEHNEPKPQQIKMRVVKAPPVFAAPKLVVPRAVHAPKPEPVEAPKVIVNQFVAPEIKMANAPVPKLLHTGDFAGSSVAPTVAAPIQKVQTGGFGDDNGLKGTGKQGAKLYAAQAGGFDMPVGPGQGNGSGGAKGIKGTVASADFGSGVATGSKAVSGSVATGGFGAEQVVHKGPVVAQNDGPATSSVEITYKPQPVYTEEARNLKLEGEVLLEVMFGANGTLHVNRVVRGLGHGLDEAAIAAANKMRFKPAQRMGQAIDSTAVVHVMFQMAY